MLGLALIVAGVAGKLGNAGLPATDILTDVCDALTQPEQDNTDRLAQSIAADWDAVAKLDVGEDLTAYAGLMAELGELHARRYATMKAFAAKHESLHRHLSLLTAADLEEQYREIRDLAARGEEIDALAADKRNACQQYYDEHFD